MTRSWGQYEALFGQQRQLYEAAQVGLDEGDTEYVQSCMEAVVALAPSVDQVVSAVWEEVLSPLITEPEMLLDTAL